MNNSERPLVSVLMTAYNREKYIAEAIESVLASTYSNFELIIVDDFSKDRTVKIAKEFALKDKRVRLYINEKNLGDYPNRNKAAGYANGKYIKFLDSDDVIYNWGLAYCMEMIEKYPEAGMGLVSYNDQINDEILSSEDAINRNFFKHSILQIGPSGTIFRKDAFENIGRYNPNYGVPSDMYFNLKMASNFPIVLLHKDFFYYRRHEGQEFNNKYSYLLNNYKYINDVLKLSEFPLPKAEKDQLLLEAKKSFVREFLVYLKNTGNISKAIKAFRYSKIGMTGFLKGVIKNL